jgi:DNA polymerase-1
MVKILYTTDPLPQDVTSGLWVYNALDSCITLEVLEALLPQLDENTSATYAHALAMQAPILEMECRGIRVDKDEVIEATFELTEKLVQLQESLQEILIEGVGLNFDEVVSYKREKGEVVTKYMWNSPAQLKTFFYSRLGLPPVRTRGKITVDRKALEKLRGYFYAEPIINHILAIRDISKKLGVLRTGIDRDGRIRTSYNIAGTDTGRLSSYASSFGSGTNLQNITGELRRIFVADPGHKLCYIDLEQAESRAVGAIIWNVFGDGRYLDFCESGDLHTGVCQMTFDLPWTADPKENKKLASAKFYRDKTYRDASKTLGHGSNYYGKPPTMAQQSAIKVDLVKAFQDAYFLAFPGIPKWHAWVRNKLYKDGWITSFMGRRRWFFGRRWEDETVRAAIAYEPQSAVADYLNRGLLAVWRASISGNLPVQLLLQVHDAIVFQYPAELENIVVPKVQALLEIEVPLMNGRTLTIPTEAMVGWNWGYSSERNVGGLVKYNGNDTRKRPAKVGILDRRLLGAY